MIFLFRLLSHLPLLWLHRLGAAAGWLVYLLSPRYRRNLRDNLAQAGFVGEKGAALRRAAVAEAGKQMLETARIWMKPLEAACAQVLEVRGWEHVEAAQARGKGILFLTPHLGCFEIAGQYCSRFVEITVLYRPPRQAGLQRLMLAGRQRERQHMVPADLSGVRALIRALKKGEAVGILPDQVPKKGEGVWLDFFGRPAHTMTLAARLSKTGATVLMTWGERLPAGQGYRLYFYPPEPALEGDTLTRAQQLNAAIETLIRRCPAQYLWGYNRYKGGKSEATRSAEDAETART
jgi:KDO2-lipid IV(A) lauroyltransferase